MYFKNVCYLAIFWYHFFLSEIKIKFNMMGIENGKVEANAGGNKVISCIAEGSLLIYTTLMLI